MKNTQIDAAMRKAFQLGDSYREYLRTDCLNAASDTWREFEQHLCNTMLDENGDTEVIDEEIASRK